MQKIIKMGLCVSVVFMMNLNLAFGMEEEGKSPVTVQSKLKESPRTLSPSSFEKAPKEIRHLIVRQAVFEQCLDNKSPVTIALVCKKWETIVKEEMKVGHAG